MFLCGALAYIDQQLEGLVLGNPVAGHRDTHRYADLAARRKCPLEVRDLLLGSGQSIRTSRVRGALGSAVSTIGNHLAPFFREQVTAPKRLTWPSIG
jgi:hypothetical protein